MREGRAGAAGEGEGRGRDQTCFPVGMLQDPPLQGSFSLQDDTTLLTNLSMEVSQSEAHFSQQSSLP